MPAQIYGCCWQSTALYCKHWNYLPGQGGSWLFAEFTCLIYLLVPTCLIQITYLMPLVAMVPVSIHMFVFHCSMQRVEIWIIFSHIQTMWQFRHRILMAISSRYDTMVHTTSHCHNSTRRKWKTLTLYMCNSCFLRAGEGFETRVTGWYCIGRAYWDSSQWENTRSSL